MGHARRHAAHYTTDLRRINFTNHNPGYDQISERAEDDKEEDAGDRHPGVLRRHVVVLPELDEVHVYRQDDHCHAATERRDEGKHSSATFPAEYTADDSEYDTYNTHGDSQPVLVRHRT